MTFEKLKPALAGSLVVLGSIALAACQPSPAEERAAIERDILSIPGSEEMWSVIKREYPADFGILVDRLQALDAADRSNRALTKQIGEKWRQEFFAKIAPDSIKAPAEEMLAWSAVESRLFATLQISAVDDCAAMTMGGWISIDESDVAAMRVVEERNAAMVRAAAAGRDDPQDYAEPDEAAFTALGDAIANTGIDPRIQQTLGSQTAMMALPRDEQCELGVAIYRGLNALPDEDEVEMAAFLLSPIP